MRRALGVRSASVFTCRPPLSPQLTCALGKRFPSQLHAAVAASTCYTCFFLPASTAAFTAAVAPTAAFSPLPPRCSHSKVTLECNFAVRDLHAGDGANAVA